MKITIFISLFFISQLLFSQGEISTPKVYNKGANSASIKLNSNGIGANYRSGYRNTGSSLHLLIVDFDWIRHPKERKVSNPYFDNQDRFVFGKLNSLYNLKVGYGRKKTIFKKFDKGGISIGFFASLGPSLGLVKPIYYEILEEIPDNTYQQVVTIKKFNSSIHSVYDIYGKASFFDGIDEIEFTPGAFIKAGFDFEYGDNKNVINAIEVGATAEFFSKSIPIMAFNDNKQIFFSLYLAYRYGKVKQRIE